MMEFVGVNKADAMAMVDDWCDMMYAKYDVEVEIEIVEEGWEANVFGLNNGQYKVKFNYVEYPA